jgi:hypothetical protein
MTYFCCSCRKGIKPEELNLCFRCIKCNRWYCGDDRLDCCDEFAKESFENIGSNGETLFNECDVCEYADEEQQATYFYIY